MSERTNEPTNQPSNQPVCQIIISLRIAIQNLINTLLKTVLQSLPKIFLQSLSAACLTSTERKHALWRVFLASANGRHSVVLRNAADTKGATGADVINMSNSVSGINRNAHMCVCVCVSRAVLVNHLHVHMHTCSA